MHSQSTTLQQRRLRGRGLAVALVLGLVAGGCKPRPAPGSTGPELGAEERAPEVPFELRPESTEVLLTWFDDHGGPHTANCVDDVPGSRRETVRVDPSRPELRRAGWVYVADLRAPGPRGSFNVIALRAEVLAERLLAQNGLRGPLGSTPQPGGAPPSPATVAAAPSARSGVIVYGASWCHACHQAAEYLRARHVAFVEKDIEQDPAANQEMQEKARRAGIPTGSIPILDVRGRMLVGFSPEAVDAALAAGRS